MINIATDDQLIVTIVIYSIGTSFLVICEIIRCMYIVEYNIIKNEKIQLLIMFN